MRDHVKVNLCLPGMCATVYARPDSDPAIAARRLAMRYERETGRALSHLEESQVQDRIATALKAAGS